MAHIYLGVADEEHFESEVEKFGLECTAVDSVEWGWEYKVFGPREKIERFLRESYCVGAHLDFAEETIAEIEN